MPDFLDEIIDQSTREDPTFPQMVEAALCQRRLMRELADASVAADLSQATLATAAGTSQSQIARAGNGDLNVQLSTVANMAAVLGRRLEWILVDAPQHQATLLSWSIRNHSPRAGAKCSRGSRGGGDSLRLLYFCSGVDRVVHASGDLDDCRPGSLLCRFVTDMRLLHCLDRSGHLLGS